MRRFIVLFGFFCLISEILPDTWYRPGSLSINWATPSSWQYSTNNGSDWYNTSTTPNNSNSDKILIRSINTVEITSTISADQIEVESGGILKLTDPNSYLQVIDGTGIDLLINGTLNFSRGYINNSGVIQISSSGIMNLDSAATKYISGGTLNNYGTINLNGGDYELQYSHVLNNHSGALLDVKINCTLRHYAGATINNAGTFRKSGGTGNLVMFPIFNNTGNFQIQSGKIIFYNNSSISKNLSISSSCSIQYSAGTGNLGDSVNITGNGSIYFAGGDVSVSGSSVGVVIPSSITVHHTSGTVRGTGKLTINGTYNWTGGSISENGTRIIAGSATLNLTGSLTKFFSNGTLTNEGTINWEEGDFQFQYGPTFNNQSGALFDIKFNGSLTSYSTHCKIYNRGTFRKSGGTGTAIINNEFYNTGTFQVQSGKILFYSSGTLNNDVAINTDCTLEFAGNHTLVEGVNLTGNGTFLISTGQVSLSGTSTGVVIPSSIIFSQTGGGLFGSGKITFNGTFNWSGGTISDNGIRNISTTGTLNLNSGLTKYFQNGTLNNAGVINYNSGGFEFQYGPTFNNQSGGLFDIKFDGDITTYSTHCTINNAGTFRKSGGTVQTRIHNLLNNTGNLEIKSGKILLYSSGTIGSNVVIDSNCTLEFFGNHTLTEGINLTGKGNILISGGEVYLSGTSSGVIIPSSILFNQTDGALRGSGKVTFNGTFNWRGGVIADNGIRNISASGVLNLTSSSTKYFMSGTLNNYGVINYNSGGFEFQYGPTFNNQSGGLIDIKFDGDITTYGTHCTMNNAGTFRKSSGSVQTRIYNILNNSGNFEIKSGKILLYSSGTIGSSVVIDSNCTLEFYGNHTLTEGINLSGKGTILISGGEVVISGTSTGVVIPDSILVNQSGGAIRGGGKLTINGTMNWTGGYNYDSGLRIISESSTLNLSGGGTKFFMNGTLYIKGKLNWIAGGFQLESNATLNISHAGVFDIQFDASLTVYGGTNVVNDSGIVKKSGGSGNLNIYSVFNLVGTLEIQSGKIYHNSSGTFKGILSLPNSTTMVFAQSSPTITENIQVTGNGTIQIGGAEVYLSGTTTGVVIPVGILTELKTGYLRGTGKVTINGVFNWTGGGIVDNGLRIFNPGSQINLTGSNAKYLESGSIDNYGTFTWTNGNLDLAYGSKLNNKPGGIIEVGFDGIINSNGSNTISDSGVIRKTGGTGVLSIQTTYNCYGTLLVQSGRVNINSISSIYGTISIAENSIVAFLGSYSNWYESMQFSGNGKIIFGGADIYLNGTNPGIIVPLIADLSGGTIRGSGKITFRNILNWSNGMFADAGTRVFDTTSVVNISGSSTKGNQTSTIYNYGTINWSGGELAFSYNVAFYNQNSGVFNILFNGTNSIYSGTFTIYNSGLMRKTGGSGVCYIYSSLSNSGTVEVDSGSLNLMGGGTHTGSYDLERGTYLNLNNYIHNINTGTQFLGSGTIVINSTTNNNTSSGLTINSSSVLKLNSGELAGSGILNINGKFSLGEGTLSLVNKIVYGSDGVLEYSGTSDRNIGETEFTTSSGYPKHIIIDNPATIYMTNTRIIPKSLTLNRGTFNLQGQQLRYEPNSTIIRNTGTITNGTTVCYYGFFMKYINTTEITTGMELTPAADGRLDKLTINGSAVVNLNSTYYVNDSVVFLSGKLNTGSNTLHLRDTTILTGENNGSYLVGKVRIIKSVGTGSSNFGGIGLQINSGGDNLGNVTVTRHTGSNAIVTNGSKTSIARKWEISSSNPPSAGRELNFNWIGDDDNGKNITTMQIWKSTNGSSWTNAGGPQSGSSRSVVINTTSFSHWTVAENNVTLNLTALTQGLYDGSAMIPDTFSVEIRGGDSPFSLLQTRQVRLNSSGQGSVDFSVPVDGTNYYLIIKHRNSIETWSKTVQQFSAGALSYDFSASASKAYGDNLVQKGSKWCIYSGDVNQDGQVSLDDLLSIDADNQNFATGYLATDINGDEQVTLDDLLITDANNQNFVSIQKPGVIAKKKKSIQNE